MCVCVCAPMLRVVVLLFQWPLEKWWPLIQQHTHTFTPGRVSATREAYIHTHHATPMHEFTNTQRELNVVHLLPVARVFSCSKAAAGYPLSCDWKVTSFGGRCKALVFPASLVSSCAFIYHLPLTLTSVSSAYISSNEFLVPLSDCLCSSTLLQNSSVCIIFLKIKVEFVSCVSLCKFS